MAVLPEAADLGVVTQPVLIALAEVARPTRRDLLADGRIAQRHAVLVASAVAETDDRPDEFVPGHDRRLDESGHAVIRPIAEGAFPASHIVGAQASRVHSQQHFAESRGRHWPFVVAIVMRPVTHDALHRFREMVELFHVSPAARECESRGRR